MKLIAVLVVRDETDVIELTLPKFACQFDSVYIFDTGSVDNTWEVILDIASKNRNVIPVASSKVYFSNQLRGLLWEFARSELRDGDWFARIDADEVYDVSPREFLRGNLNTGERVVFCRYYDFLPTESEMEAFLTRKNLDVFRHYRLSPFAGEPRLFRYHKGMKWLPDSNGPISLGRICRTKIPVRHYPCRSIAQIKRSLALRMVTLRENGHKWEEISNHHWSLGWERYLAKHNDSVCLLDPEDPLPDLPADERHLVPQGCCSKLLFGSGLMRLRDLLRKSKLSEKIPRPMDKKVDHEIQKLYETINAGNLPDYRD